MIRHMKIEFDVMGFEQFVKQIQTKIYAEIDNAVFERETFQTLRIFEDRLWKSFNLIPKYKDYEVRLSFGVVNDSRIISGSAFVRQIGSDYVQKVDFSSIK